MQPDVVFISANDPDPDLELKLAPDLGTFGEHVERSDPPRLDQQADAAVRALRRRFLTLAIDSAASSILHLRLMLSEADVDDLPVQDANAVGEPLSHIFYEASRLREQVARLATGRDHYVPFLLSSLDGSAS